MATAARNAGRPPGVEGANDSVVIRGALMDAQTGTELFSSSTAESVGGSAAGPCRAASRSRAEARSHTGPSCSRPFSCIPRRARTVWVKRDIARPPCRQFGTHHGPSTPGPVNPDSDSHEEVGERPPTFCSLVCRRESHPTADRQHQSNNNCHSRSWTRTSRSHGPSRSTQASTNRTGDQFGTPIVSASRCNSPMRA